MREKDVRQVNLWQMGSYLGMDYIDDNIALYKNFHAMPTASQGVVQIDMCVIVVCTNGRMKMMINGERYAMEKNSVMVVRPNALIKDFLFSPDFEGSILCLSDRIILECLSEGKLWSRAFYFLDNPIVSMDEERRSILQLYQELLQLKINSEQTLYRGEVILSMVRTLLYELLSMAGDNILSASEGRVNQRDVLFKRFMLLLSSLKVKPRFVAWYADKLCVTPKHLSTVCKQVCGRTALGIIGEYVQIDIHRILKNSDKSVKEVSDYLGFPNISFFGKYCRAHFGLSPRDLRRSLKEQPGLPVGDPAT